ncbi:MAG TPA: ABC transporter ATP-binding protein [Candidatus Sulfotelmatobacter sp.]|nr:ABC transporter ATP-binding protein [Candidatus Sulfotelmatobacter sp.]
MRISVESLSKRYGRVHALDNVNLAVDAGQIVAVLGINGAGKTTFLRCLCGIVAGKGRILYDGVPLTRENMQVRRRIAFLPDFPIAFPHYTVMRHVGMVLRLYGVDEHVKESRILDLFRGFDILPLIDTPVSKLSRGQAYKAALAALLAVDPDVLLLDEPFASGMDPNGITFLKQEARAGAASGRTIIYSTQILDIAEDLADRVLIIDRGEVRYYAPLDELQAVTAGHAGGSILEQVFQQLRSAIQ